MVVAVDDISDEQKARICKSLSTADKVTFSEAHLFIFHTRLTNNNKSRRVAGKSSYIINQSGTWVAQYCC